MPDIVSDTYTPDEGPEEASIVLIGEAPGTNEREQRRPFCGDAGQKLESILLRNGIQRSEVRLANLCHYQPTGNDFDNIRDTEYLASGLSELRQYFISRRTPPTVVVPLGKEPLSYVVAPQRGSITQWRGSILRSNWDGLLDTKIIPTFHPSAVLRDAKLYPIVDFDIRRVFEESQFREFNLPQRNFVIVNRDPILLESVCEQILAYPELAVDIEGYAPRPACVGFSGDPSTGFCIVCDGSSHTESTLRRILESPIPKIFHFGTYDEPSLRISGIKVNNYSWDTYIAAHVMFPELPRTLAFWTSVVTREPYYKWEGKIVDDDEKNWDHNTDPDVLYRYNIKDVCCTLEIKRWQAPLIARDPNWARTFMFEMSYLPLNHDMMLNGMPMDLERLAQFKVITDTNIVKFSSALNTLTDGFLAASRKKKQKQAATNKQAQEILYEMLGLPVRKSHKTGSVTTDEDALVSLMALAINKISEYKTEDKKNEWKIKLGTIKVILKLRELEKLKSSYLNMGVSLDGRVRSVYKFGPETGRLASANFIDGTGFNGQTLPRGEI